MPLREGLERTIAWTRENRECIDALHRASTPSGWRPPERR